MNFKGAIFDMDGTLVDSLGVWEILWEKIGEKYLDIKGFRPSKEDDKLIRTMLLADGIDMIHKNYKVGKSGIELLEFTNDLMKWFYKEVVCLKDGVEEYLDYLSGKGVKMCIASATSPDLIELALDHCNLRRYFPKLISCADVGKGKDEPDVFLEALEYLGTTIEETCVIEDSLVAIKTASKAGFKTIGIYDENNYGQAEIKEIADEYIDKGETFKKIVLSQCY